MKIPKILAATLMLSGFYAMSATGANATPLANITANDTANFEAFMMQNPSYLLLMKDTPRSCSVTMQIHHPVHTASLDRKGCEVVYTAVKPNGLHEFITYSGDNIITLVAPPGGIIRPDGTHWRISNVMIASMTRAHKPIMWETQGTCISNDGKALACTTDDGKVAVSINMKSRRHESLKD